MLQLRVDGLCSVPGGPAGALRKGMNDAGQYLGHGADLGCGFLGYVLGLYDRPDTGELCASYHLLGSVTSPSLVSCVPNLTQLVTFHGNPHVILEFKPKHPSAVG
jgi:hypothetical protein